jgi:hypothetical protein
MKIIIDEHGDLYIKRVVRLKKQTCPFDADGTLCGDWCPLFGEPETGAGWSGGFNADNQFVQPGKEPDTLTICQGRVLTGEIEDGRNP